MFATLDNLEKELKQEVKKLEDKWDKEPKHDYHFHEICGINIAIDVVERFKSKAFVIVLSASAKYLLIAITSQFL